LLLAAVVAVAVEVLLSMVFAYCFSDSCVFVIFGQVWISNKVHGVKQKGWSETKQGGL
jgi:hypothetical protein